MLVCTGVAGCAFWEAVNEVNHDYALEVDIERRRNQVSPISDPEWDQVIADMREQLGRIWPDLPSALAAYENLINAGNSAWVEVGSSLLPVNLVSPSDFEFSRSFKRVAKLPIPE